MVTQKTLFDFSTYTSQKLNNLIKVYTNKLDSLMKHPILITYNHSTYISQKLNNFMKVYTNKLDSVMKYPALITCNHLTFTSNLKISKRNFLEKDNNIRLQYQF